VEEIQEIRKWACYAKWKALNMLKVFQEGRQSMPGADSDALVKGETQEMMTTYVEPPKVETVLDNDDDRRPEPEPEPESNCRRPPPVKQEEGMEVELGPLLAFDGDVVPPPAPPPAPLALVH
jgi:hypothetical protein